MLTRSAPLTLAETLPPQPPSPPTVPQNRRTRTRPGGGADPAGEGETTEAPGELLRPVDWDGSFARARAWAARDAIAVADRPADEYEAEPAQQQVPRSSRCHLSARLYRA
ncbi:hypothetical protein MXD59_13855 [Frankia sp. Ag45/Mut15]|uniref:Uncharacterized protein n=1 Tax=Frankia umida TaxID=573489 RepID=A0ABT0K045_9ACTN|nr:hypothetical protein [Frankia umida]MCK9876852.1 hypothetical protein [Frankia umida]